MSDILIISGTNRNNSYSIQLAEYYQSILEEKGVKAEILDLSSLPEDFLFSALYENSGKNENFNQFQERVDSFNKFVFIVAEYNGSFPGVLKAFIDGLEYPNSLKNKKAALVGLSAGDQGGALALSHLSDILSYMGTNVLAFRPRLSSLEKNFREGKFINRLYEQILKEQANSLITF
ncbi:NAD(P)H-dependent oxidoreductase [Hyphobacterium sp. CCMP332]|nr:NAD(P)H-dependent oxidoreductase [Hyphobacterium sp. CCMP332]